MDVVEWHALLALLIDDGRHDDCSGCRVSAAARSSTSYADVGGMLASDAGAVGAASRNWSRL